MITLSNGKKIEVTLAELEEIKAIFKETRVEYIPAYRSPEFQPWGQPIHPFWHPIVTCTTSSTATKNPI